MGTRIKATQLRSSSVSDLTNTTWVLNEPISWSFPTSGYSFGQFNGNVENYNLNFTSNSTNYTVMRWADSDTQYASAGRGGLLYGNTMVYDIDMDIFYNQAYRTITITGGTDATNSNLITWLETNATQQETPSGTNHTHLGSLSIIKKHFGDLEVIKETLNGVTIYEKGSPSTSLISFTIGSVSYQAESGMTWSEWVASAYNTGGWKVQNNSSRVLNQNSTYYVSYSLAQVNKTEEIVANREYSVSYAGGGGDN